MAAFGQPSGFSGAGPLNNPGYGQYWGRGTGPALAQALTGQPFGSQTIKGPGQGNQNQGSLGTQQGGGGGQEFAGQGTFGMWGHGGGPPTGYNASQGGTLAQALAANPNASGYLNTQGQWMTTPWGQQQQDYANQAQQTYRQNIIDQNNRTQQKIASLGGNQSPQAMVRAGLQPAGQLFGYG